MNLTTWAPVALAGLLSATPAANAEKPFEWQTATPQSQGMSREKLDALKAGLAERNTKAFLVVRNDRVVYEWYADGHGPAKTHYTASLAKAVVVGLSLAVALTDGRIALDDRAAKYVPQWKDDPRKSKITIRHSAHTPPGWTTPAPTRRRGGKTTSGSASTRPTTPSPSPATGRRSSLSPAHGFSTATPASAC